MNGKKLKLENRRPLTSTAKTLYKRAQKNSQTLVNKQVDHNFDQLKGRLIKMRKEAIIISHWMNISDEQLHCLKANDLCELEMAIKTIKDKIEQMKDLKEYPYEQLLKYTKNIQQLNQGYGCMMEVRERLLYILKYKVQIAKKKSYSYLNIIDDKKSKEKTIYKSDSNQQQYFVPRSSNYLPQKLKNLLNMQNIKQRTKKNTKKRKQKYKEMFLFTDPQNKVQINKKRSDTLAKPKSLLNQQNIRMKNFMNDQNCKKLNSTPQYHLNRPSDNSNSLISSFTIEKKIVKPSISEKKKKIKFDLKQSLKNQSLMNWKNKFYRKRSVLQTQNSSIEKEKQNGNDIKKKRSFMKKNSNSVHNIQSKKLVKQKLSKKQNQPIKKKFLQRISKVSMINSKKLSMVVKEKSKDKQKNQSQLIQQKDSSKQYIKPLLQESENKQISSSSDISQEKSSISSKEYEKILNNFMNFFHKRQSSKSQLNSFRNQHTFLKGKKQKRVRQSVRYQKRGQKTISLKKSLIRQQKDNRSSAAKPSGSDNIFQGEKNYVAYQLSRFIEKKISQNKKDKKRGKYLIRKIVEDDQNVRNEYQFFPYKKKHNLRERECHQLTNLKNCKNLQQKRGKQHKYLMNKLLSLREQFEAQYRQKLNVQSKNSVCSVYWKQKSVCHAIQSDQFDSHVNQSLQLIKNFNRIARCEISNKNFSTKAKDFLHQTYQIDFMRLLTNHFSPLHQIALESEPEQALNLVSY